MQVITSKENEAIKQIKKLKDKKYREEMQKYIIEGTRLLEEAIREKVDIDTIIICEECLKKETIDNKLLYEVARYDCIYVTEKIFAHLTDVKNPQGIMAVVKKSNTTREINYEEDILVILDHIQDPGNMGTILRTVDSVGLKQVILSLDCADPYNTKVIRSTMGAIFRVNMIEVQDLNKTIQEIKQHKFKIYASDLKTQQNFYEIPFEKSAIIIGNEANGISNEVLQLADQKIKIPMLGKTESLNASVATGILLYEYVRQKLKK